MTAPNPKASRARALLLELQSTGIVGSLVDNCADMRVQIAHTNLIRRLTDLIAGEVHPAGTETDTP